MILLFGIFEVYFIKYVKKYLSKIDHFKINKIPNLKNLIYLQQYAKIHSELHKLGLDAYLCSDYSVTNFNGRTIVVTVSNMVFVGDNYHFSNCSYEISCIIEYIKNDDHIERMAKINGVHQQNILKNIGNKCNNDIVNIYFENIENKSVKYRINKFLLSETICPLYTNIHIFINYYDKFEEIIAIIMKFLHSGYIDLLMDDLRMIADLQNIAKILTIDYLYNELDRLAYVTKIKSSEPTLVIDGYDMDNNEYKSCFGNDGKNDDLYSAILRENKLFS